MKDWKTLSTKQKIARLEKQLEEIDIGIAAFQEFRRLSAEWLAKVKTATKSDDGN